MEYFAVEKTGIPIVTSDEIIDMIPVVKIVKSSDKIIDMIPVETKIPVEENLWIPVEEEELTEWIQVEKKKWNIDDISGLTEESKDWLRKTMKKK